MGLSNKLVTYYPPNVGAFGEVNISVLEPGTIIDRYGHPGGSYTFPVGTPYSMRALPVSTDSKDYAVYEVLKSIPNV